MKIFTYIFKTSALALAILGIGCILLKDVNEAILCWCGTSIMEGFVLEDKIDEKKGR